MLQGLLWRCVCVCVCVCVSSKTAFPLYFKVLYDMLGSQRCSRDCSGVLVVASLEEARWVLSHFDCVYSGYITQGCAGGALVGCYEPTCQMLLFPYTHRRHYSGDTGTGSSESRLEQLQVLSECTRFEYSAGSLPVSVMPCSLHLYL